MNETIKHLEEKIAYLEHHATEQDKVMLGFAEDIARLRREITLLAARLVSGAPGAPEDAEGGRIDERPPHY